MLPSYLLSLREGLEAALIIGIVLGALKKIRRADLSSALWQGTLAAALVSASIAILLVNLGLSFEGKAEELFEGFAMTIAAGVLTWMIFWMNAQSRALKSEIEEDVNRAATSTGKRALFGLAFVAVVREGIELALFLVAAFFAVDQGNNAASAIQTLAGAFLGIGTAILLGWALFATTIRLNLRRFFQVTGVLLILFAAGLVAHGVHEFNEAGWIPAIVEHVWDINAVMDENSLMGQLLKALFGYNSNPSLTEVAAYLAYLTGVIFLTRARRGTGNR